MNTKNLNYILIIIVVIQSIILSIIAFRNTRTLQYVKFIFDIKNRFLTNQVTDLNGNKLDLLDVINKKNSLIYLFSYNCQPCIDDDLKILSTLKGLENLSCEEVIAICPGNYRILNRYINIDDLKVKIFVDRMGNLLTKNGVDYLPSLLFVNSKGYIIHVWKGKLDLRFSEIEKKLKRN